MRQVEKSGGRAEDLRYCRGIQEFLETFKVRKCTLPQEHREEQCVFFHSERDRRRNPYAQHRFLYYPTAICNCDNPKCGSCHCAVERSYHPLVYKTGRCGGYYECGLGLVCGLAHHEDEMHFGQGEFFRFDLSLFKTKACGRKEQHERKVCLYFHNDKDRRRPNCSEYSHMLCQKPSCNFGCERAHNKIEQLYHPSRYKSKYCQTYPKDVGNCEYRDFCSFAHTREQLTIELIDAENKDPGYIVAHYKTVWCPFTLDHDRSSCPYAHNIQDYRRRPRDHKYLPDKCEAWDFSSKIESIEEAGCRAGMACGKCHGWMEQRYHPQVFGRRNCQPLEKKLIYSREGSRKSRENGRIEAIALRGVAATHKQEQGKQEKQERKERYAIGAPFFKSEREASQGSKKTKARTGQVGSDRSCDGSDNNPNRAVVGPHTHKISSVYFQGEDHSLWNFEAVGSKEETRSKSQGNSEEYEPSYSRSIRDMLGDSVIEQKLRQGKVNEVSLLSLAEGEQRHLSFLEKAEREKLVARLREYCLRKAIGGVEYSRGLTVFFIGQKADHILEKLRERRVRESTLLRLHSRQAVRDLAFLSEAEREWLPRLVKQYSEERDFTALMASVDQYLQQPAREE